jgi:hypothetical protein
VTIATSTPGSSSAVKWTAAGVYGVFATGAAQLANRYSYATAAGLTVMAMGITLFRDAATLNVNIATGTALLRVHRSATGDVQGLGGIGLAGQLPEPAGTVVAATAYDAGVNGHPRCRQNFPRRPSLLGLHAYKCNSASSKPHWQTLSRRPRWQPPSDRSAQDRAVCPPREPFTSKSTAWNILLQPRGAPATA